MNKKGQIVFLLLLLAGCAFGGRQDSLLGVIKGNGPDSSRAKACTALGAMLSESKPDSADLLLKQGVELAKRSSNKPVIINALAQYGTFMFEKGLYPKALQFHLERLRLVEELGDKKLLARSYIQLGNVYVAIRDFEKGLAYQSKALDIYRAANEKLWIAVALNNIGVNYFNQKNYDSALAFFERARVIREKENDKKGLATSYGNIGNVYAMQNEHEKSLGYMMKSKALLEELKNKAGLSLTLANIGSLYVQMNQPLKGLEYLELSLEFSVPAGFLGSQEQAYENLYKAHEQLNDIAKALAYYKKYVLIRDSGSNQQTTEDITRLQLEYEYAKKEELERAIQEKKDLVAKQEAEKEAVVRYLLIGGLVLLLVFVLFVFRSFRQKQRSNRLLQSQKNEIEEQKKEIQDSIVYARLIQRSLLPSPADIEANFKEIFGLYKPKDVVSGDFYWFYRSSGHVFIAAVDCTGHGVPGAFMSSIGSEKLTEGAHDAKLSSPSALMAYLNKGVKAALRQNEPGSRSRDGMDIALLRFDHAKTELVYAGANRPLWMIRQGELLEYKSSKAPIGGLTPDHFVFEEQRIALQPGDRIYIFTDGFPDQFGGPNEKKFMTGKFRELLLSIHHLPMKEQEKALERTYADWKGHYSQTDDVLVIGISI